MTMWRKLWGPPTGEPKERAEVKSPEQRGEESTQEKRGFFNALRTGLTKTRQQFLGKIEGLLRGRTTVTEEVLEELEEALIISDISVHTVMRILDDLRRDIKEAKLREADQIKDRLKASITRILEQGGANTLSLGQTVPDVLLVVGVNGVGKTTTIGKLAHRFTQEGKKVLVAAGDTFRAAAIEQLEIWAQRVGVDIIKHQAGADPSAVIFDAIHAARARRCDLVIADTAGRLHTKVNLMEELKKMKRVVSREVPGGPQEVLLVLDATIGQNALAQAKEFHQALGVTGLVLTKLDGTAKGGIVISIVDEMRIPVKFVGIGEKIDDLRPFSPHEFVEALF